MYLYLLYNMHFLYFRGSIANIFIFNLFLCLNCNIIKIILQLFISNRDLTRIISISKELIIYIFFLNPIGFYIKLSSIFYIVIYSSSSFKLFDDANVHNAYINNIIININPNIKNIIFLFPSFLLFLFHELLYLNMVLIYRNAL